MNLKKHLQMIRTHRKFVRKACFKMGIPWLGLMHDLSKYSFTELKIAKYYIGVKSPHGVARTVLGYSPSWYHHRNRNKHHFEYWIDSYEKKTGVKMPYEYVVEMFCDFVGASKAYGGEGFCKEMPWDYWLQKREEKAIIHAESRYLLKKLLWNLHESESEKAFYKWYRGCKDWLKKAYEDGRLMDE